MVSQGQMRLCHVREETVHITYAEQRTNATRACYDDGAATQQR